LTLLEPVALIVFHQNLTQVVQVIDVSMALILVGLGSLYLVQQRKASIARIAFPATSATPAVGQLGVNR
jgi:hypothetical protein